MSEFKPLRTQSFSDFVAKSAEKLSVFKSKTGRLYVAPKDAPNVCMAILSQNFTYNDDITDATIIGTFLNSAGEEVQVVYNEGSKDAEFDL